MEYPFSIASLFLLIFPIGLIVKTIVKRDGVQISNKLLRIFFTSSFLIGIAFATFFLCVQAVEFITQQAPCIIRIIFTMLPTISTISACFNIRMGLGAIVYALLLTFYAAIITPFLIMGSTWLFDHLFFKSSNIEKEVQNPTRDSNGKSVENGQRRLSTRMYVIILIIVLFLITPVVFRIMEIGHQAQIEHSVDMDTQRMRELNAIQTMFLHAAEKHIPLPSHLSSTTISVVDPETKQPYAYEVLSKTSFKLCATFHNDSVLDRMYSSWSDYEVSKYDYTKGYRCFVYTVPLSTEIPFSLSSPGIGATLCYNQPYRITWEAKNTIQKITGIALSNQDQHQGYDVFDGINHTLTGDQAEKTWDDYFLQYASPEQKANVIRGRTSNTLKQGMYMWVVGKTLFNEPIVAGSGYTISIDASFLEDGEKILKTAVSYPFSIQNCLNTIQ